MSYKLLTPHDTFWGNVMEIKSIAESFFKAYLPPAIREALDWSTLKLTESARRYPGRKTSYTDITYVCYTKKERKPVYLHCEQQRNRGSTLVERILRYNLGLYSQHRRQGNKQLPIVVNFVLYNNPKALAQPYPAHIWDHFEIPWMAKILKDQYFHLINSSQISDETLASHGPCGPVELLLKRAGEHNFVEWLKGHKHLMKDIRLKEVFSLSLSYALAVEKGNVEDLMNTFSTLYPQYKQIAMTAVRQLEKKGEIKGRQARNIEIARSLLQDKEPIEKIIKWTGLNKEDIEKIIKG